MIETLERLVDVGCITKADLVCHHHSRPKHPTSATRLINSLLLACW